MKKALRRSLSLLLAITLVFGSAYVGLSEVDFSSLFAVRAKAATSGTTGDCTWTLDGTVLTISGKGNMFDYMGSPGDLPWDNYNGFDITNVIIEEGVTSIGESSFHDCESLVSIVIPNTVTRIGEYAFRGCTSLGSVTIPNSLITIGRYAFYGCTALTSVAIPDSLTSIDASVFKECSKFTAFNVPDSHPSFSSVDGVLFNKNKTCLIQYPQGKNYTENAIPDSVTSIGDSAFSNHKKITSITIPDNITSIGAYAFNDCSSLVSAHIGNNVINIGNSAFASCESLSSVVIPDSVVELGSSVFSNCSGLSSVKIGNGVTSINDRAFNSCSNLKSIEIPDNVINIGAYAFSKCVRLETAKIGSGVENIASEAFYNCGSLKSIEIPDSVTAIGSRAFFLTGITKIFIPRNVNNIGVNAFANCFYLEDITVDSDNQNYSSINGVLFNKTQDTLIKYSSGNEREIYTIPDGVTSINADSFGFCRYLKTIVLNKDMVNISSDVFNRCDLNSVVVPAKVESININAFGECIDDVNAIPEVLYEGTKEQWNNILIAADNGRLTNGRIHYGVDYDNWGEHFGNKTTTEPTCTKNGSHKYTCPCGYEKTEVIPYTGHNYSAEWTIDVAPTCTTSGSKSQHCTKCTAKRNATYISPTGHTSSDWIIDNDKMIKYKECTVCKTVLASESIYAIPATPKVTTSNEIGGVKVNWNAVEGAVKYNVYRRQGGSSAWVYAGTTTGTTLLDTSVNSGVYYIYSVRAYNYVGQYSAFVSANTSTRKYMAVPKLVSISNATNGLHIKWDAVDGVTNGYRVYRRGAGSSYWTYLGTVKTTSYTDTAVKDNGGEYFRYTVIADGGYHSKFDITGLYLRRIGTPVLKSATSIAVGNIVRWGTVKGCNEYYVYRKTSNSNWVRIGAIDGANSSAFVDTTAKKGTTYTYTVKAVYGKTMSAYNSGVNCYTKY